jgi:hypothetical protein
MELDLASGFPNLTRESVRQALISDNLIPTPYVDLILTHLSSPLQESNIFPTFQTYAENHFNRN